MPVKIRLQRHGKKGKPFYWVVAADSRAKRDGKYLEKLGTYNPNTNPATIDLNIDGSVKWLQNGAQPSETAKRILSYKGVLMKHHLLGGVRKGALTEEQVEEKFNAWLEEKAKIVENKVEGLSKAQSQAKADALKAEKEVNEKRAMAAAEAAAPPIVEEVVEEVAEIVETASEEVVAETAEAVAPAEEVVSETAETVAPAEEATPAAEEATPSEEEATPSEEEK